MNGVNGFIGLQGFQVSHDLLVNDVKGVAYAALLFLGGLCIKVVNGFGDGLCVFHAVHIALDIFSRIAGIEKIFKVDQVIVLSLLHFIVNDGFVLDHDVEQCFLFNALHDKALAGEKGVDVGSRHFLAAVHGQLFHVKGILHHVADKIFALVQPVVFQIVKEAVEQHLVNNLGHVVLLVDDPVGPVDNGLVQTGLIRKIIRLDDQQRFDCQKDQGVNIHGCHVGGVVVFLEVSHDTLVHFVDLADALLDGPVAFAAERVVLYVNP